MASKAWRTKLRAAPTGFEQWGGYMEAKKQKLNDQFAFKTTFDGCTSSGAEKLFSGIAIFVNGFTHPSAEDLKTLMAKYGGVYHTYSRSNTTHIIATNLPHFKIKKLKNEKVVRPEWITDSIAAEKLLPCSDYQLYTSIYNQGQTKINFDSSTSCDNGDETLPSCSQPSELLSANIITETVSPFRSENSSDNNLQSENDQDLPETTLKKVPEDQSDYSEESNCTEKFSILDQHLDSNAKIELILPNTVECATKNNISSKVVKAGQPNFLSDYYNKSRLHHISTAAADFKDFVNQLHINHKGDFPGREHFLKWKSDLNEGVNAETFLPSKNQKIIMHLDMDCFFVSVALRNHPELIGKPVAVTHGKGNNVPSRPGSDAQFEYNHYKKRYKSNALVKAGEDESDLESLNDKATVNEKPNNIGSTSEVASCSYEARQCGVKNGMFLGEAFRRCPNLQLVSYDFKGYTEVSQALYNLVSSLTLEIEAISCDEMFIDCTDILKSTGGSPLEIATFLRGEIHRLTNCTASAGIASSILVARLATRSAKPNGHFFVKPEEETTFMKKQLVRSLPGVGYATQSRLEALNVFTCEDLQSVSLGTLQKEFGPKTGKTLFDHCRGKDDRLVKTEKERKSVSAEINYGMRFQTAEEPETFLKELSVEVEKRLKKINRKGKLVTLKIKVRSKDAPVETVKFMGHGICDNIAKSMTVHLPTDSSDLISKEVITCLRQMNLPPHDIRGMGIQVSRLSPVIGVEKQRTKTLLHFMKNAGNATSSMTNDVSTLSSVSSNVLDTKTDSFEKGASFTEESVIKSNIQELMERQSQPEGHMDDQIDQSFLEAMPEDIRLEILREYKSRGAVLTNKGKTPFCSPNKKKTTEKNTPKKKRSPNKKISPGKKKKSPLKFNAINNFFVPKYHFTTKPTNQEFDSLNQFPNIHSTSRTRSVQASLCGAADLESQRKIIEEWVKSTEPLEDDTNHFLCFSLTLIDNHDLERLDLIIKCLYRNIEKSGKEGWRSVYANILREIQREMKQNYGNILKCKTFKD